MIQLQGENSLIVQDVWNTLLGPPAQLEKQSYA